MPPAPRVAVVGSANTDLITHGERFPRPGETVFGQRFEISFGGKGANQAVAARQCGAEVVMIAKVGSDLFGTATIRNFSDFGIDTSHVYVCEGAATGAATVFVEPNGQNRILVAKGANDELRPADIESVAAVLAGVDVVLVQFEIPLATVYHTVALAKRLGIRCIVNPAPALPADLAALTAADYFIPNETEAELFTRAPLSTIEEALACARLLGLKGFRKVVLTLGERGSILAEAESAVHFPAAAVQPVDTTGAGDAFIGSFAVFLAEGLCDRDAIERANLYAALSTTKPGTHRAFPQRAEFDTEWKRRGVRVRRAGATDAAAVSALLVANGIGHGGALVGNWELPEIQMRIERGDSIYMAEESDRLVGILVTEERARATNPRIAAMLNAWPGSAGAYVYGPVCVDSAARGKGILAKLYEQLARDRPGGEAILFIRSSNELSLKAHLRLGLREVAQFELAGERYRVLSSA
ncbi:MAG: ribokinase [Proteobacteria bacterium]|nr:ribokinase [Pseudomonadota bacterium]